MDNLAPIVLFVYNRPEHTVKTIKALKENYLSDESDLFIFSDAPRSEKDIENVDKVRNIIGNIEGFREVTIIKAKHNKGLASAVIGGVTDIINRYGKVIVLEDDLITSRSFLKYMNEALNFYHETANIWSISGYTPNFSIPKEYNFDVFAVPRACSWGWATWKDRWDIIDWEVTDYNDFKNDIASRRAFNTAGNDMAPMLDDQINGHINSWAIRWCYSQFKNKSYTIYPINSFVKNIGTQGDSTHGSLSNRFDTDITEEYNLKLTDVSINEMLIIQFSKHYNLRLINYVGRILKKVGLYKSSKKLYKKLLG
ncbi:hypothetical protein IIM_04099 [Bacillus cereus VD107]|nr:hypothetical protein IIM_04099 [Bacillus cereus VD107]